jgi:hypothetical protein
LDVTYAVLVEQHERAALAVVSGGGGAEVLSESREQLDAALNAHAGPGDMDPDQWQLRVALGVA